MKKILLVFMLIPSVMTAQTLDECQQAAERNYPLIRQYDLIKKTTDLTVKNLQKGWLPHLIDSPYLSYQQFVNFNEFFFWGNDAETIFAYPDMTFLNIL
jgi:hypothetical protein